MVWDRASRRRDELPPDWSIIRRDVLQRDGYRCRIVGPRCIGRATECDHVGSKHDHSRANLRAACAPCHRWRSSRQGHAAARASRALGRHPEEQHPGFA